jgi:hypothetical protein
VGVTRATTSAGARHNTHDDHLPVFEVGDPPRPFHHRRSVRRQQILVIADAQDEGRALARPDEQVGLIGRDDGDTKGAVDL